MSLDQFPLELDDTQLQQICTSRCWQQRMKAAMPFRTPELFAQSAEQAFAFLQEPDWLEAFAGHPMIGDIETLEKKYAQGKALSEQEQRQIQQATQETLQELLELNQRYFSKFGFIFIVCATNKSAQEMLTILKQRINHSRKEELLLAALEQQKISHIRMGAYL